MGLLEDALRDTFAAQVEKSPVVDDAAGRAIRRARLTRGRRSSVAVAAVAASVFVTGFGVASMKAGQGPAEVGLGRPAPTVPTGPATGEPWQGQRPGPSVSATSAPARPLTHGLALPVDILNGNEIYTAGGRIIPLPRLPEARNAWRVPGGWLVETFDSAASATSAAAVWYVPEAADAGAMSPVKLAVGTRIAVGRGASGPTVSWGGAGRISIATFTQGHLVDYRFTDGTGQLGPVAVLGDAVVFGVPAAHGAEGFEVWFPAKGAYVPGPRSEDRIVGLTADASALFAFRASDGCLRLLTADFRAKQTACRLDLDENPILVPAPGGRRILVLRADRVDLYDLQTVWSQSSVPQMSWAVTAAGAVWLDDNSFAVAADNSVVRLSVVDPQASDTTQVFAAHGGPPTVISDLRT